MEDRTLREGETLVEPLPDVPMYRAMAAGHKTRKGHPLRAHLESDDGQLWHVVRECCGDDDGQGEGTRDHGRH